MMVTNNDGDGHYDDTSDDDHDHHDGTPNFWGNQSIWYTMLRKIKLTIPTLDI